MCSQCLVEILGVQCVPALGDRDDANVIKTAHLDPMVQPCQMPAWIAAGYTHRQCAALRHITAHYRLYQHGKLAPLLHASHPITR